MNVVMITPSLPPLPVGGAEMQALILAEELRKRNILVSFLTPGKSKLKGEASLNGIPVKRLFSFPNRLFDFFSDLKKKNGPQSAKIEYDDGKELTDQITRKISWPTLLYYHIFFLNCLLFLWPKRRSFDVIHAHTMEWSAIVAARLGHVLGKPVILKDSTMNGFQSIRRFPMGERLQKMIIRRSSFVAITRVIETNLKNAGVPEDQIFRIPNGINITEDQDLKAEQSHSPIVLFVGNLYQQPAKGIDILLKAWCSVNKNFPGAMLKIIGDGNIDAYTRFTASLGIESSVHFLGKQVNPLEYYRTASIFVLPSRREGMSNALMEAMLNGLPCVATNISGNQDLIDNGRNGILVPPKEIDSLASGICYMIAHPEEAIRMGEKAREKILKEFNIRLVGDRYVSLYNSLLNPKRS